MMWWSYDGLLDLAKESYPEFVGLLESAPTIVKADIGRLLAVHRFGGLYVDLDYLALHPLDGLFQDHSLAVSRVRRRSSYYIQNALFAAAPRHPLMLEAARIGLSRYNEKPDGLPEWIAGPDLFGALAPSFFPAYLPEELVCPVDWSSDAALVLRKKSAAELSRLFPKAYSITFWSHNW